MTKENLIEFGFEEVSDEVGNVEKDWIDVVWDNFLEELFGTKDIKFKELTKYCLRQQIEKYMPKRLCRIIKRGDLQGKEFDYIIIDENVTEEQIKEMQAGAGKEKEERERDRIDDLIDDIENGLDVDIRLLIESHIPKKKKFTVKEVTDYYMKIEEGLDKGVVEHNKKNKIDVLITSAIVGFLRYHDLLEE